MRGTVLEEFMEDTIEQFMEYLRVTKNVSDNTLLSYKRDLIKMKKYFFSMGVYEVNRINSTNMTSYILHLEREGMCSSTISRYMASIKSYFRYLQQNRIIDVEPTITIKTPVIEKKIPNVLSISQVDNLLSMPSGDTAKEIRDKAMLEILYATGIRVSELISLKLSDINTQLGYINCKSKNKDRSVPFGITAKKSIVRYIEEGREELLKNKSSECLFVNCSGMPMSRQGFWKIIKHYGEMAGIDETITPHTLRHSFALHLVENGADLRAVQEMMGHSVLSTTQIYADMKKTKIRDEYIKSHPRN